MGEPLANKLLETAAVLRWLGKNDVANALTLFARWLDIRGVEDLDTLEAFVVAQEECDAKPTGDGAALAQEAQELRAAFRERLADMWNIGPTTARGARE